ncbi:MAG: glycosyltransferase, partial [Myxococcales bacterium]|nr:glycosyltransferase [Myxococcales bacterium]
VEPDLGVFLAALDYNDFSRVAGHPNLYFVLGGDTETATDEIRKIWTRNGMRDVTTVVHWPSVRRAPDFYEPIQSAVRDLTSRQARRSLAYPKLRGERFKVLFLDTGFHLQRECAKALRSLGHKVEMFRNEDANGDFRLDFVDAFREAVLGYRPDMVFTINHKGFDKRGDLTHMLEVFELPLVSWFVDSPTVVHQGREENVSPWVSLFTWEKSYIEPLQALGFEETHYLPLATDPSLFRPHDKLPKRKAWLGGDVAFVGNSMVEARARWDRKAPFVAGLGALIDRAVDTQLADRARPMRAVLEDLIKSERWQPASEAEFADLEATCIIEATLRYRLAVVNATRSRNVEIYGDAQWKALIPGYAELKPWVDYYEDLPYLYRFHNFNVNATSLQMDSAVNQRVFDVAACGAFLLTDWQADLDTLFDASRELVVYQSPEEIPELIDYYRVHTAERDRIREAAHFRVRREHTYQHRIAAIVDHVRAVYAKRFESGIFGRDDALDESASWNSAA